MLLEIEVRTFKYWLVMGVLCCYVCVRMCLLVCIYVCMYFIERRGGGERGRIGKGGREMGEGVK